MIHLLEEVAVVAEWSRYRIDAGLVTNSSPVPLKTRRKLESCWQVRRGPNSSREVAQAIGVSQSVISRIWNRFETGSAGWKTQDKVVDGQQRPMKIVIFSVNGSETSKYERYSSPTTPRSAHWHHGFNSDCPKPAPWCKSVCSPTDVLSPSLAVIRTQPTASFGGTDEIRQRFRETRDKYYFIFSFNV
ncbi:hypothetical protein TNCV_3026051 [Trichonephila clavipes]|nr:hypothetical protein TNCV_3026051 [Trichonephila clavipes]